MFQEQLKKLKHQAINTELTDGFEQLHSITLEAIDHINQGDLPKWQKAFENLPALNADSIDLISGAITIPGNCSGAQQEQLKTQLQQLIPWRKGPFSLFGVDIDSEWRSDKKWQRLVNDLPDLKNKLVLDVGCGNGYYLMKMAAYKPQVLLGIEPGVLHNVQFWTIQKYAQTVATMLPLKIQHLPRRFAYFDVVFSMGVLYHRKSPIEHLEHLKGLLKPGGELILETLVVEGDEQTCLVPGSRYAQMRNVWFLPSVAMLCNWLDRIGFKNCLIVDESNTTISEQRATSWMRFHSLINFLNVDQSKTIEGYPPPRRVIIRCQK